MTKNNFSYDIKNICCIGAGYVGGPSMAVIADKCPDINVIVVDTNQERISQWNKNNLDELPIYERGLDEIVKRVRNKNLFFSSDVEGAIRNADMIFISVNTPIKTKGIGAGQASNLHWVEVCARQINELAEEHTIVVEKSTLPVRTAQTIKNILSSNISNSEKKQHRSFSILSNPEFLSEGNAIDDLENPDRVLIGGDDLKAIKTLKNIYESWVPTKKIICTNLWSSELSKLVSNAFLAQRISSINTVSAICEASGAQINEVSKAIGSDSRIGKKFLNAGPGFGGSCFKKDILNLVYLCKHFGLYEVAEFWEQVVKINNWQQNRIFQIIFNKLFGNVIGKKITILGFSFKSNTNDTRESPAIEICRNLLFEGANLTINDPKVSKKQISKDLLNYEPSNKNTIPEFGCWTYEQSIIKSIQGSDAVVVLTEWEEYKNLNWQKISLNMRKPAWVFDTRLIINKEEVISSGLNFWGLGDGT